MADELPQILDASPAVAAAAAQVREDMLHALAEWGGWAVLNGAPGAWVRAATEQWRTALLAQTGAVWWLEHRDTDPLVCARDAVDAAWERIAGVPAAAVACARQIGLQPGDVAITRERRWVPTGTSDGSDPISDIGKN